VSPCHMGGISFVIAVTNAGMTKRDKDR
jgi:hypothetical protein